MSAGISQFHYHFSAGDEYPDAFCPFTPQEEITPCCFDRAECRKRIPQGIWTVQRAGREYPRVFAPGTMQEKNTSGCFDLAVMSGENALRLWGIRHQNDYTLFNKCKLFKYDGTPRLTQTLV